MWVFQSYTNPAHKCDVKCFIAIQHLRERSTFSISSPKSQRAVNISLQQSNISEIGQHSHQAVQHLSERPTFSSRGPNSRLSNIYDAFWKKKTRSCENQISYNFILHQLSAFEHYYLKKIKIWKFWKFGFI